MTRKAIVLKLLNDKRLAEVLRNIYFSNIAYKGYMSPDNLKHLSNAMLGHIYHDTEKGKIFIEHLKENGEIPKFYLPTMGFYASVIYSLSDDTIYKSLEEMANLDPKSHSG